MCSPDEQNRNVLTWHPNIFCEYLQQASIATIIIITQLQSHKENEPFIPLLQNKKL